MKKTISENEKLYHIGLCKKQLNSAKIAILPGDPARVELLAKLLDKQALPLAFNREYCSYLAGMPNITKTSKTNTSKTNTSKTNIDEKVLVISTGMGSPSVSIGLEELAMLGVKKFIRVGTTGAIQEKIQLGDLILNTAAVRLEGTSSHYAPIEYPAVADFELTQALRQASQKLKIPLQLGIGISSDTFWAGQERYDSYSGFVLQKFKGSLQEWRKLGLLNFEMETSALFTICSTLGLQAASICCVIAKRTKSEKVDKSKYQRGMELIMQIVKQTIKDFH